MYSLWFIRLCNAFVFSNAEPPIIIGLYEWLVIWSLLNCVPHVLTCQRALRASVLTRQLALRVYVFTYQRALYAHVLTCQRALCAHVLTCQCAKVPCVLTCSRANVLCVLTCSRGNVLCVPTCSRTMSTNDKGKFSITCLPYILWLFFVIFPWNKTFVHFCVSLTSQKPLTGAMTNFVKWNALVFVWA